MLMPLDLKMVNQGKNISAVDALPDWVVDSQVRDFLESEGFELVIYKDEKYRSGLRSSPLIVLRRTNSANELARTRTEYC
jgi:hypothetical protein